MKTILVGALGLASLPALGQADSTATRRKADFGLEGMLAASIGPRFYSLNVGGPSFRLRLTKDLKVGVGALPSLYVKDGKLGAKLGVSPRLDYRDFVLIAPFFHFENQNRWKWSVGLGYMFKH
jgi:hypothetical protein